MHKFFPNRSDAVESLIVAAQNGQIETVQYLIAMRIDLDATDPKSGATVLLMAAQEVGLHC